MGYGFRCANRSLPIAVTKVRRDATLKCPEREQEQEQEQEQGGRLHLVGEPPQC